MTATRSSNRWTRTLGRWLATTLALALAGSLPAVLAAGNPIATYAAGLAAVDGTSTASHARVGPLSVPGVPDRMAVCTFPRVAAAPGTSMPFPMVITEDSNHSHPAYPAAPVWAAARQWRLP